jgi:hypothetical protein
MPPEFITPISKQLLAELHPTLNNNLDVSSLAAGSNKKVWWQCSLGHEWEASPSARKKGGGCPVCGNRVILPGFNDMATVLPELAKQFHPVKNLPHTPQTVGKTSSQKFTWVCELGHEFTSNLNNRVAGSGCPTCAGKNILTGFNDIATLYPELVPYWNIIKNGERTPENTGKGYSKKVWWVCDEGHEYEALVSNRRAFTSCNICSGKQVLTGFNDIATTNPEIVKYWHPTKNPGYAPQTVTRGLHKKMWWTCENGHEYESLIANRVNMGDKCSWCAGNKLIVGVNDLASKKPELVAQWSARNTLKPNQVFSNSNSKAWWVCEEGHEWEAIISNRFKGTGCPVCAGHRVDVGVNDLGTLYPELSAEWHPTKNGSVTPQEVTAGLSQSYWWQCERGHEFSAHIRDRVLGDGCNKCYRLGLPSNVVSLAEAYPGLSKEWDYEKNLHFTPETVAQTSNKRVWWKCSTNPEHSWITPVSSRTKANSGCPVCWKSLQTSKAEQEIGQLLADLGETPAKGERSILDGQEIDYYLPDRKLGIEYNGLYWHSEAAGKDSKYHQNKLLKAQSKQVALVQIWEDDWLERKSIVMRHVAYRLGKLRQLQELYPDMDENCFKTVAARKTHVEETTYAVTKEFLNKHHIQGAVRGTKYLTLNDFSGDIKAAFVLSASGVKGEYLIARYAAVGIVQGGFSKLLKAAINLYKPTRLVTFADLTISEGSLYENTGFTAEETIRPDYSYVKAKKRYHKFGFRLKRFKNDDNLVFKEGLTEKELAELNGYTRVWDAGKVRYVLDLPAEK